MTISTVIAAYGVVTGLLAISVAIWSLTVHNNHFDSTHIAALYIVGTILTIIFVIVDNETRLHMAIFGILITSILYWVLQVLLGLYRDDPVRRELRNRR